MFDQQVICLQSGRNQVIGRIGDTALPVLVWIHGVHGLHPADPFVAALSKKYHVIAPLAPGFADVVELDELRSIHDLALHYDDVFEALELKQANVIGHSFGAMIAAELAAHMPDRVARLGLLSPVGLWRDALPVADLFATPYTAVDTFLWDDGKLPASMAKGDDDMAGKVDAIISVAQGMTAVAKFLWPIPDKGLARRLYRIKAKTLIVFGERDRFVPAAYADDFASAIAGSEAVVLPGVGHMVPYESQPEVLVLMDRLLG